MQKTKIVFLGGGNMAEAIFKRLIANSEFNLEVIQRSLPRVSYIKSNYPSIKVSTGLDYRLKPTDILILAIKPQHAKEACLALQQQLQDCLIVSVMAGVSSNTLSAWLNNQRIVRTMPNTPASLGLGVTAIYYTPSITPQEQQLIQQIFANLGLNHLVNTEEQINKILPVTSSAIAVIYYFIECLIEQAVTQFDFAPATARELVLQTFNGSLNMITHHPEHSIAQLRAQVTSKKGTTEQAIATLVAHDFSPLIGLAMQNCYQRAREMASELQ